MRTTPPGSTIPTAELAAHLRITIARAARRLRQESGGDLGPTLGAALATVERFGPITPSQLAERERIRRPSATRIVAKLEQHGYLERHADPADGRSCLVRATDAGVAHLAEVRSRRTAFLARRLDGLGADDRETLERAATILEQLLEAADPVAAADPTTSGAR